MTARAMAEAFAKSQQNAAEVQGSLIAKAIADSQKHANETLASLFASIQKGGALPAAQTPQIVIENNNTAAALSQSEIIAAQAKAMAQAQIEAQKEILEMQKKP